MNFFGAIHSEFIKVKHTIFKATHVLLPLFGAFLFTFYFILYKDVDSTNKLRMILELTATIFPLLISVVVSLNITLEEKTSHFHALLASANRKKIFLAKLITLYLLGILALCFLFLTFILALSFFHCNQSLPLSTLITSIFGIAFFNLIIYIWHLFITLRFGFGIGLFCGVFESLQCILYSNIAVI